LLVLSACTTNRPAAAWHGTDWSSGEPIVPPVVAKPEEPKQQPPAPAPELVVVKEPAPIAPAASTAPAAPVVIPKPPVPTWVALERWCKENGIEAPHRVAPEPPSAQHSSSTAPHASRPAHREPPMLSYELKTANGAFKLHPGSHLGRWDGLEVQLGFAPLMINGQLFVHSLDLQKSVQPLLTGIPQGCLKANSIIVIDPGHGGESAGTKSVLGNRYEKEFTLDWALRLGALLANKGWQVVFTRTNDTNLSLSNRVAVADRCQAGLFLSLHFNSSAPDESQSGLETYCLTPTGLPSTVTRGFSDDQSLAFPNNLFDIQNLQFASLVHRALLQATGDQDRGVRRARFLSVLRAQQRPAILIEGGYLSNPREARRIADPAYRQKLAEAVAKGLEQESKAGGPRLEASSDLTGNLKLRP
jgi:N-acetylmuramoyl-L-alanine amidase